MTIDLAGIRVANKNEVPHHVAKFFSRTLPALFAALVVVAGSPSMAAPLEIQPAAYRGFTAAVTTPLTPDDVRRILTSRGFTNTFDITRSAQGWDALADMNGHAVTVHVSPSGAVKLY